MFDQNWEKNIYLKSKQNNNYPFDWIVSSTKKYLTNFKKKKIIELGSGTGNNIIFFKNLGFKSIEGIEGSKTACKIAKNKFGKQKKIKIFNNDFINFDFKKNYYDLVVDRGSITHNEKKNIIIIFNNIYKSLKPNGLIFSSIFSDKHYAYKNKADKKFYFKNETKSSKGLITTFLNIRDIKVIFKKFKLISLVHETKYNHINKKKDCWWYIIAKK